MTSRPTLRGPRLVLALALAGGGFLGSIAVLAQEPTLGSPGQTIYRARCASCHDAEAGSPEATRAPSRAALRERSRDAIVAALSTGGSMAPMATGITAVEKAAIAAFLSPIASLPADPTLGRCATQPAALPDPSKLPRWNGWGNDPTNARFQPAAAAGLTTRSVPKLTLKWAFGIPGGTAMTAQPTVFAGRLFFGSENGTVYALDATTGCTYWQFKADAGVRSAVSVGPIAGTRPVKYAAYFGDFRANVHAVDALTGERIWSLKVDDHAAARITGGPTLVDGRLYVPVSSLEELPGARPNYPCCTFRGSIVAIDANTGKQLWKTYTIPEAPTMAGKNAAGTPLWKPAGAAVWAAPTVDVGRKLLYAATGNAYTDPAAPTSDAVIAMSLETGAIQWVSQVTPKDSFVVGCRPDNDNCPDDVGPDFDFGNSPILRRLANGRSVIVIGQKSGVAYGMDPDKKGAVVWQYRAGQGSALGGIEWGSAADEQVMYVPVSDVTRADAGGLHAIGVGSGERIWHTPAPALTCKGGLGCTGAQSAAISVIPGVVFSGSVDGHIRAYDTGDGRIIWDFDTVRDFDTVNGVRASGGSIDGPGPTIAGGMLYTGSGYGRWLGRPGNVLLAFAVQ
ncbi:MAG TPA: PQQ-binding-like beta-propeller repeat protein [Vicinamibacterales bacterium]|nr:PQQ-binding-like beta-propeller repeat protein [Vicinamibacterales bacterium]